MPVGQVSTGTAFPSSPRGGQSFSASIMASSPSGYRPLLRHAKAAASAVEHFRVICEYVPGAQPAEIRGWMSEERFFRAREALAAGLVDVIANSALPMVYLKEPPKRRPTTWLRSWREFYEQHDARCA